MIFTEIAETVTITFDMETLEVMARACRVAAECGDGKYPYEAAASAFTAATMIARVHGAGMSIFRNRRRMRRAVACISPLPV